MQSTPIELISPDHTGSRPPYAIAALAFSTTAGFTVLACLEAWRPHVWGVTLGQSATIAAAALILSLWALSSVFRFAETEQRRRLRTGYAMEELRDQFELLKRSHDGLAHAQALASFGSWTYDPNCEKLWCSDEMLRLFALTDGQPTVEQALARVHGDDRERVRLWFEECLRCAGRSECEYRIITPDGGARYVLCLCEVSRDSSGRAETIRGTILDVNERTLAMEQQMKFSALIENGGDLIGMSSMDGVPFYINPAGRAILGMSPDFDLTSTMVSDFFTDEAWEFVKSEVMPTVVFSDRWEGELSLRHFETGRTVITQASIFTVRRPETGEPVCMATVQSDVTEQKWLDEQLQKYLILVQDQNKALEMRRCELAQANAKLEAMATTDGLTDLKNHRAFQEKLTDEYKRARRYKPKLSVLMLDVDKFKGFNDTYGHPEGDKVLKSVANILLHRARDTDLVARYGGEEFVILLPNTDAQGALEAAERFRSAVESFAWSLRPITVSVGAATLKEGGESAQELVDAADRALYASKERGRNCSTHADAMAQSSEDALQDACVVHDEMQRIVLALQCDPTLLAAGHIEDRLLDAYDSTIRSWSRLLDMKDKETEGHSERVTMLTERLARRAGLAEREVIYIRWGALLHDIGKMGVPDRILLKPGPLTEDEWAIMRKHTLIADEMLSPIPFLRPAMDIPRNHHEKWDGTGYPAGLKGNEIPLAARLFAVVDVWDALRSDRPYREGWAERRVSEYLRDHAGSHFDPRAVEMFLQMLDEEGVGWRQAA